MKKEGILKPFKAIRGGAHLPHFKNTAECASQSILEPDFVTIPMQQHIGAPCTPTVKAGDRVYVGSLIGNSDAFVSAPIHSSVSGTVKEIKIMTQNNGTKCEAVVIENDKEGTIDPSLKPFEVKTPNDLVLAAKKCGLVGLGGAGFPTHIKLMTNDEKPVDTLIINGAECEPYITADYRECIESPEDVLYSIYLIKEVLNLKQVIIGVEDNKPKALKVLYDIAANEKDVNDEVKVMKLKSHYPQGAEKVLIYTTTGRKVPLGKLPADVGCIVMNITSIAVLARFVKEGLPLVYKRVTVDGNAVEEKGNYLCPIGTSVSDLLSCAKCNEEEKIIMGGPMMGNALVDKTLPIVKSTNAILAFKGEEARPEEITNCINCGRCLGACPMNLRPRLVESALALREDAAELKALNVEYCIECGSCAFNCPARRPLVQAMRLAKTHIRKAGKK